MRPKDGIHISYGLSYEKTNPNAVAKAFFFFSFILRVQKRSSSPRDPATQRPWELSAWL